MIQVSVKGATDVVVHETMRELDRAKKALHLKPEIADCNRDCWLHLGSRSLSPYNIWADSAAIALDVLRPLKVYELYSGQSELANMPIRRIFIIRQSISYPSFHPIKTEEE